MHKANIWGVFPDLFLRCSSIWVSLFYWGKIKDKGISVIDTVALCQGLKAVCGDFKKKAIKGSKKEIKSHRSVYLLCIKL